MMTCDIRRVVALSFLLLAGAAARVCAQQVFIDRLWVHFPDDREYGPPPGGTNGTCASDITTHQITCDDGTGGLPGEGYYPTSPLVGNISNEPHIEFDRQPEDGVIDDCVAKTNFPYGTNEYNYCNSKVFLCMRVGWSNDESGSVALALDYINFEVFKFKDGTNPLDTGSAPPLRTFYVDSPGIIPADSTSDPAEGLQLPPACVMWDGSINIDGEFGKSNGQYGFRATVETNQLTAQGNVKISQTRAYPGGWTQDASGNLWDEVDQKPITVDVNNIHMVRSTPTVVGTLTGVAAQPYNITYRLAKDATMYLYITQAQGPASDPFPLVRSVVPGQPRVGEGIPSGTLRNGDAWDGRYNNGDLAPPGVYLATLLSVVDDQWGRDLSIAVTRQIALDTLQITDIRVQPLTDLSTSLAVLSYFLTEPATVYVDIYPPGTEFLSGLNDVNHLGDLDPAANGGVSKQFTPCLRNDDNSPPNCLVPAPLIRHMEEFQDYRKSVLTFWDGRDKDGRVLMDGDYVFVLYAALPSRNGFIFTQPAANPLDKRIWSTNAKSGFLPISRGYVTVSQIGPSSTVIGSSPAIAGLDPFTFTYSLSRDAMVSLKVYDANGTRLVKTLVDNQVRPANFQNRERWSPPTGDDGEYVSSGTYLVQLTAADSYFPTKVTTTTVFFPLNLYRITDLNTTALLTGATDVLTVSYQLSQPMLATLNIYPPGTTIVGSTASWPPCQSLEPHGCWQVLNSGAPAEPLVTIKGMRPGRLRITEFWDGRDQNGIYVPDGAYVFTVVAQSTTSPKQFATDQITGTLTVARGAIVFTIYNITPTYPALFNSSATISLPSYEVDYSVTRQSSVTIQILTTNTSPYVVRNLVVGQVRDANVLNRDYWDGRNDVGQFVTPGFYTVRAIAEDLASVLSSGSTAQQTISVDPLRIYDVAVSPLDAEYGSALIAFQVSETMRVGIKIYRPGTVFDTSGNPSPPESQSLVKRIVMVGEARREISQPWDGLDDRGSPVPDGNYLFKIVASTDMLAIDQITGNVRAGAVLAQDLVIAEIPVVRGPSMDPVGDFERDTYVYPNPVRSASAHFHINVPLRATVGMKIFNLAGDLVRTKEFGERETTTSSNYCTSDGPTCVLEWEWDLKNDHGRKVAAGTYFYVVREESTQGESVVLQTVKKILIP